MVVSKDSMTLYKELLDICSDEISGFLSNATKYDTFLNLDSFNINCYEEMYKNCKKIYPRQFFFKKIPELEQECKKCWKFFLNPRNKSIKGLDIRMGQKFEVGLGQFLESKGFKYKKGDDKNKRYPDNAILSDKNKLLAFYEVKYHQAPFVKTYQYRKGRECYEGSLTLDYEKIRKQIELINNEVKVPVFYMHWVDFPCIKGLFVQSSSETGNIMNNGKEFNRKEREGDYSKGKKVGYTDKFYPSILEMMEFSEFLNLLTNLKVGNE